MNSRCSKCGILITGGKLCQTCRKYQRNGGVWYIPPKYGTVAYDENGKPICHVCGMACNKLIEHTKRKHGLNSQDYRKQFGLMDTTRLTSPEYSEKMRIHAEDNKSYKENFKSSWSGETRYVAGRKGQHWSKQELELRRPGQVEKGTLSKTKLSPDKKDELGKIWAKNLPNKK